MEKDKRRESNEYQWSVLDAEMWESVDGASAGGGEGGAHDTEQETDARPVGVAGVGGGGRDRRGTGELAEHPFAPAFLPRVAGKEPGGVGIRSLH